MTQARLCKIVYLELTSYNVENNNVVNQKQRPDIARCGFSIEHEKAIQYSVIAIVLAHKTTCVLKKNETDQTRCNEFLLCLFLELLSHQPMKAIEAQRKSEILIKLLVLRLIRRRDSGVAAMKKEAFHIRVYFKLQVYLSIQDTKRLLILSSKERLFSDIKCQVVLDLQISCWFGSVSL